MLIVSQDKNMIINFDRVINIYVEKNKINYQCPDIEDFWGTIGTYESEERAKEVLREIVNEYSKYLKLEGGPAMVRGGLDIQPNIFNIPKVYEMPQK